MPLEKRRAITNEFLALLVERTLRAEIEERSALTDMQAVLVHQTRRGRRGTFLLVS